MKVSVVVTVLNEEEDVSALLESLLKQTLKADEIIVVDGGSSDNTVDIVKTYEKAYGNIRLIEKKTTRAEARNLGISHANNLIIATTDAGCIAETHWLKRITRPLNNQEVDLVAGFYEMIGDTPFRKALSVFLGVNPSKFDYNFVASARSLAFTKGLWEKVGGFPECLKGTAEDTLFNYKIIKLGARIARVKNAVVYWKLPQTYGEAVNKMYLYAKGDALSGIWWHPLKGFSTHNLKILFIYFRYLTFFVLSFLTLFYQFLELPLVLGIVFYIFWSVKKVYVATRSLIAGFFGVILQLSSDMAVMAGFLAGMISKE